MKVMSGGKRERNSFRACALLISYFHQHRTQRTCSTSIIAWDDGYKLSVHFGALVCEIAANDGHRPCASGDPDKDHESV
jgi:hypothetical protein